MLIPCDEVNILNTFRVMIILRLLLLLTNLHLKLLSTQRTGADKLLSTQKLKCLAGAVVNVADSGPMLPKGAEFNPRWRQGLSLSKKVYSHSSVSRWAHKSTGPGRNHCT